MDDEDEEWLSTLNASIKKPPSKTNPPCTENQFEEVMSFFESTAALKQPFASVDNAPVLAYIEMETAFDDTIEDASRRFAKEIYEHWKLSREKLLNHPVMPALKFERNAETDDADPYVCFRRREVRQARKTRGRDAQVAEKLKKLRLELEQARQLLHLTKQRETSRREQMVLDRFIFEQRAAVKEAKRNLGIKGDDADLINQKVGLLIDSHHVNVANPCSLFPKTQRPIRPSCVCHLLVRNNHYDSMVSCQRPISSCFPKTGRGSKQKSTAS